MNQEGRTVGIAMWFRMALGLYCALIFAGCAASTQLTKNDIRLYSNTVQSHPSRAAADSFVCVSYNIAFAEELDLALDDLRKNEITLFADILFLQEMNATGAAYLAAELGM